ncbi:MAG: hypothetical protein HWQ38_13745 [Nostoc sp. NMS7]|uniref:hypothetical protein n=1 Tax=Nostoc sp. NMS7 TaxID=2815391 RepID=UPI0025CE868E|nr:hypothetical protein [Nostoc sp. NMS7]MBN3947467.1 hypothetical protein [Nostoc sp. NMS7]
MPYDITMCPGQNCPLKQNCSRFTDEILGRQDFFGEAPYNFITNSCEHFISNRPDVFIQAMQLCGAWDRNNPRLLGYFFAPTFGDTRSESISDGETPAFS